MRFISGHNVRRTMPLDESYVSEDRGHETPCWIWQRQKNPKGYGQTSWKGRTQPAYVVLYEREHGSVPTGMQLDHLCRQRACVNPAHMEPVSPAENVRRSRVAKLTLDGARDIRRRSSAGESQYALAAEYGVTQATISSVTRGLTWREGL
jgi:hypothetical protein